MRRFYLTGLWEAGGVGWGGSWRCGFWSRQDGYPRGTNPAEHQDGEFTDFFKFWVFRGAGTVSIVFTKFRRVEIAEMMMN